MVVVSNTRGQGPMAWRREASSRACHSASGEVGHWHRWEPLDNQEVSLLAPRAPGDIVPGESQEHHRPGFRLVAGLPSGGHRGWIEKLAHRAELGAAHGVGQEPVVAGARKTPWGDAEQGKTQERISGQR